MIPLALSTRSFSDVPQLKRIRDQLLSYVRVQLDPLVFTVDTTDYCMYYHASQRIRDVTGAQAESIAVTNMASLQHNVCTIVIVAVIEHNSSSAFFCPA
jgi:hypothetical protein